MKIVIDAIPLLSPLTGVGCYTKQLVWQFNRLAPNNDYVYFYGYFTHRLHEGTPQTHRLKNVLWKIPYLRHGVRTARDVLSRVHGKEFDLYFEPNFIPLDIRAKKTVIAIHDFSTLQYPSFHPRDRVRDHAKRLVKRAELANKIITGSSFIKMEAMRFLPAAKEKIFAIPLGVDHETFKRHDPELLRTYRRELGLPEKFILFVGTREPRKNLKRLFQAYLELPEWIKKEVKLVLVGPEGWKNEADEIYREKTRTDVLTVGYVNVQRLAEIYNLASVFVFPSLYEGFGLPPLEAMACGCPVVVSKAGSLPEVCGAAARYVDPNDVSSIAEGIYDALTNDGLRRSLISRGLDRVRQFTWEKTASDTLAVFNAVLSEPNN